MTVAKHLKELEAKSAELAEWLAKNTRHPDFMKVASERNHLSVEMEVYRQKVNGQWVPQNPSIEKYSVKIPN